DVGREPVDQEHGLALALDNVVNLDAVRVERAILGADAKRNQEQKTERTDQNAATKHRCLSLDHRTCDNAAVMNLAMNAANNGAIDPNRTHRTLHKGSFNSSSLQQKTNWSSPAAPMAQHST